MGQHNRARLRVDLMRARSRLQARYASEDWQCMACLVKYHKGEACGRAAIFQDNGVRLYVCIKCLALAAAKTDESFRTVYAGEFEEHKVQPRLRAHLRNMIRDYDGGEYPTIDMIFDLYKVQKRTDEELTEEERRLME